MPSYALPGFDLLIHKPPGGDEYTYRMVALKKILSVFLSLRD
jgi:hypothetical protein